MPEEPYDQVSFGDKIAQRRRAREEKEGGGPGELIAELRTIINEQARRIAALEDWKNNLKGRNGIQVVGSEISFQGKTQVITGTVTCQDDGSALLTINVN